MVFAEEEAVIGAENYGGAIECALAF